MVEEFVEEEEEVAEEEEEGNPKGCARLSQAVLCPFVSLSNSAHTVFCAPASTAIPDPLPHHSFALASRLRRTLSSQTDTTDKVDSLSLFLQKCLRLQQILLNYSYECVNNCQRGGVGGVYLQS